MFVRSRARDGGATAIVPRSMRARIPAADWAATPPSVQRAFRALHAEIRVLRREIARLQDAVRADSHNSSRPPSSDPPARPRQAPRPRGRRRRGAQRGHRPTPRTLVDLAAGDAVVPCVPTGCRRCGHALHGHDPQPTRWQVFELPRRPIHITEYQIHALACAACGTTTRGAWPAAAATGFGPHLTTVLAWLSVRLKGSVRDAAALAREVFGVPLATGSVVACQQRISTALAPVVAAAHEVAQAQPVAHLDETSWREQRQRTWLWVLATAAVTIVRCGAARTTASARALLGSFRGIVVSDRWVAYEHIPPDRRQLCWAHLARDWQRFVDRGGRDAAVGRALQRVTRALFRGWARVQTGACTHARLAARVPAWRRAIHAALLRGRARGSHKTARTCREVLYFEHALWTFARVPGVPLTNNLAEQQIRLAVVLRKIHYGTDSVRGSRFVERVLTVVQTLANKGRSALAFLEDALLAQRAGTPPPSLVDAAA